jgi:hypothetical protein
MRICTEAKVPRRMAWRVMMLNQVSIWFSQDDPVEFPPLFWSGFPCYRLVAGVANAGSA